MHCLKTPEARFHSIQSMSDADIHRVKAFGEALASLPQVSLQTDHVIHAKMYARTLFIPAGVAVAGVFIKIPTLLIIAGEGIVFAGEHSFNIEGYQLIPASGGRQQAYYAKRDTYFTMIFPTEASSLTEAENEFTPDAHLLSSRHADAINSVINTKREDKLCLEHGLPLPPSQAPQ